MKILLAWTVAIVAGLAPAAGALAFGGDDAPPAGGGAGFSTEPPAAPERGGSETHSYSGSHFEFSISRTRDLPPPTAAPAAAPTSRREPPSDDGFIGRTWNGLLDLLGLGR